MITNFLCVSVFKPLPVRGLCALQDSTCNRAMVLQPSAHLPNTEILVYDVYKHGITNQQSNPWSSFSPLLIHNLKPEMSFGRIYLVKLLPSCTWLDKLHWKEAHWPECILLFTVILACRTPWGGAIRELICAHSRFSWPLPALWPVVYS